MVPEGWRKGCFGQEIELISGQHVDANMTNTAGEGEPYLTGPADFPNNHIIVTKYTKHGTKFSRKGDILIVVKGSGTGKIIRSNNAYAISRQLMAARPTKITEGFAYHCLDANVKRYENAAAGLIPGISRDDVLNSHLLIPPLPEQRKIAKILQTWDHAIATTEKLINASKQQKKALMQHLLTGKKRFAGFEGEWKKNQIKDVVSITYGKSPKDIFSSEGRYNVIGTGGITGRTNSTICSERAVVIGRKGTIDKPQYVTEPFWAIDTTFFCLPINAEIDIQWFYYLAFILKLKQYNEASGVPSLSRETIYSIPIYVPSFEEQQKIATTLHTFDKRTDTLYSKLICLKQEKKALMQQLLTGKRRVKVDAL